MFNIYFKHDLERLTNNLTYILKTNEKKNTFQKGFAKCPWKGITSKCTTSKFKKTSLIPLSGSLSVSVQMVEG